MRRWKSAEPDALALARRTWQDVNVWTPDRQRVWDSLQAAAVKQMGRIGRPKRYPGYYGVADGKIGKV